MRCISEVAGVTFSDSDSVPVPKFLTPGPKEKRRILSESTPVIRIQLHLWCIYDIKSGQLLVRENDISLDKWSVGTAHLRTAKQSCKRASFWSPKPAQARNCKPEPGPRQSFIFEIQFRSESQIYRVSWCMCNCGVTKNVVYWYSCRFRVLSHPK